VRIALLFIVFFATIARGQEKGYSISVMPGIMAPSSSFPENPDTLSYYKYEEVQKYPEPDEGWSAFYDRLDQLAYPSEAKKKELEADIAVYFSINRKGEITRVKAYDEGKVFPERGKCASCRQLIEEFIWATKWKPAMINDIRVNVKSDLFISFDIVEK